MINGHTMITNNPYIYGLVHLPAALTIAIFTLFFAPLGAKLASKLPVNILKKYLHYY
jgi:uncharacterized membrane protein YfcA